MRGIRYSGIYLDHSMVSQGPVMLSRIRRAALTLLGAFGGAITLFGSLQSTFWVADWAHERMAHWHLWTCGFWTWSTTSIGIQVPGWIVSPVTLAVFFLLTMIGTHTKLLEVGASRSYAFFHPLGAIGELVPLLAVVAILHRGEMGAGPRAYDPPLLLLQFAAMCLVFGFVGTISPEAFIKRVWLTLFCLGLLVSGNEYLKMENQHGRVHGTIACEGWPKVQAQGWELSISQISARRP